MTDKINDGGPAFPVIPPMEAGTPGSGYPFPDAGMTLRDWFAGQALMGLLAMPQEKLQLIIGREEYGFDDLMAVNAYAMADAMLRAREVKS